jgi:hypothetical protein
MLLGASAVPPAGLAHLAPASTNDLGAVRAGRNTGSENSDAIARNDICHEPLVVR